MNEKINMTKENGSSVTADIICFLENNTGKRYLYYTLNEIVGAGANSTAKIYVSKIAQNNPVLDTPITDADWDKLKGYMSDALKGNENPEVKYLPVSELGSPVSVSERAIAMPISYDYINKQRGIYAENIAKNETASVESTPSVSEPVQSEVVSTPEVQETTVVSEPVAIEPTPIVTENLNVVNTPVNPSVVETETVNTETENTPEETDSSSESDNSGVNPATLKPIDLKEIEDKYNKMIESVNQLKAQELEAAKRYNATLELSEMHTLQHANYVQNEQSKEIAESPVQPEPIQSELEPQQPVSEPVVQQAPVTPEAPAADVNLETNWFDMPSN